MQAACNRGVESTICSWIVYMVRSKLIQLRILDTIREVLVTKVCAYGVILSPLLRSLLVDGHQPLQY